MTLVLGHGMWSDRRVFGPMVRRMRSGARVILLDLPGHGHRSTEPAARSIQELAEAFLQPVAEEPGPLILGGISMGAVAALHAALLRPERLVGLLLFAGTAAGEPLSRRLLYRALAQVYAVAGPARPLRWAVEQLGPGYDPSHRNRRRLVRRAVAVPGTTVTASLRLMGRRPSVEERLREIAVPVLVVTGAKDRVFGPAHAQTLATEIPAGQFHLLPDTGHAVVVERPGLSADLADALVERVRCSASP